MAGTDWYQTRVRSEVALEVRPPRRQVGVRVRIASVVLVARGQDEQRTDRENHRRDDESNAIDARLEPREEVQSDRQRQWD
jgi:hypothetical protein